MCALLGEHAGAAGGAVVHGGVVEADGGLREEVLRLDDHIAVELQRKLLVHQVLLLGLQEAAAGVRLASDVAFLAEAGLEHLRRLGDAG